MHLEIYKLAISYREEFMVSENLIGEKFMIPCKNIHPWLQKMKIEVEMKLPMLLVQSEEWFNKEEIEERWKLRSCEKKSILQGGYNVPSIMAGTSTNNLEVQKSGCDDEVKIELMVVSVIFGSHHSFPSLRKLCS